MRSRRTHKLLSWVIVIAAILADVYGLISPTQQRPSLIRTWSPPSTLLLKPSFSLFASVEKERHLSSSSSSSSSSSLSDNNNTVLNGTAAQTSSTPSNSARFRSKVHNVYTLPRTAYRIYTSYFDQLWTATNTSARKKIANDKVRTAVRQVQTILQNTGDYDEPSSMVLEDDVETRQAKERLLKACDNMLMALNVHDAKVESDLAIATEAARSTSLQEEISLPAHNNGDESSTTTSSFEVAITLSDATLDTNTIPPPPATVPKKKHRSIVFGAIMGAVVACWVFSGNYIFTGIFCLMTILGQLEYYRMVMNTGVFPARRISVIGATSMFVTVGYFSKSWERINVPLSIFDPLFNKHVPVLSVFFFLSIFYFFQALFAPELHQICLPMFGLWAMIWKLTMRRQIATIPEIATTFTGMFYLGYVPSFWVRTRLIGANAMPTRLYPFTSSVRSFLQNKFGFLIPQSFVMYPITTGAVFIFWSWLSLAFSDVGAYFVGRKYGKTKLGAISPAAGATSPNKSVEGVLGGCITSALLSILGAWVQKWPYFLVTGTIHGTLLALVGLIGDLTASMLKRDAGLKDFGDLIPEHGGILDRVDSFVWTAPYSWLVCAYIIPALRKLAGQI